MLQQASSPLTPVQVCRGLFARSSEPFAFRACWLTIAAGLLVALSTLAATGVGVAWPSLAPLIGLTATLVAVQVVYSRYRVNRRIADTCGLLAVLIISSLLAAVISHSSLRLGMPYVDQTLSAADRAIGWYSPDLLLEFSAYPQFSGTLATIYNTTLPACFVCALALGVSEKPARASEFAWCYVLCILVAAVSAIFLPALGSTVHHGVEDIAGLPGSAGNFHLPVVQYFRTDPAAVFSLDRVTGIVTFPSFHMVMALLVPYALRGMGGLFWLAVGWAGLVGLSAVVIGGHYLIDLIAGALCWAAAVSTSARRQPV